MRRDLRRFRQVTTMKGLRWSYGHGKGTILVANVFARKGQTRERDLSKAFARRAGNPSVLSSSTIFVMAR